MHRQEFFFFLTSNRVSPSVTLPSCIETAALRLGGWHRALAVSASSEGHVLYIAFAFVLLSLWFICTVIQLGELDLEEN